ncbi:hypothetical protein F5B20DRAFT_537390, partial [Whalleya microplaca]
MTVSPAASAFSTTCPECKSLEDAGFAHRILYPSTEAYNTRIEKETFSATAQLKSLFIVQPHSTEEVSKILQTLLSVPGSAIGIRSGGHTAWPGSNFIADGVTIDLGKMNSTTYNSETGVASLQPGATWGSVYEELEKHGVTAVGGRAAQVGVGGFLTGGGNSFFAQENGFGCDNVVNFEVVLADGSVVNGNKDSNSDLWRALKGGSGNLGLVTRFDVSTVPCGQMFGGLNTHSVEATPALVEAVTTFTEGIEDDPASSVVVVWCYIPALEKTLVATTTVNTKGDTDAPAHKALKAAQPLISSTLRTDTHLGLVKELDGVYGLENTWITLSYKNSLEMNAYVAGLHENFVGDVKAELGEHANFSVQWCFHPLSPALAKRGLGKGGNILGIDRFDTAGMMLMVTLGTTSPAANATGAKILSGYVEKIKAKGEELGVMRDWVYLNYADPSQNPMTTFGSENLDFLKAASKRYDPRGVFQNRVKSGFKIPDWAL